MVEFDYLEIQSSKYLYLSAKSMVGKGSGRPKEPTGPKANPESQEREIDIRPLIDAVERVAGILSVSTALSIADIETDPDFADQYKQICKIRNAIIDQRGGIGDAYKILVENCLQRTQVHFDPEIILGILHYSKKSPQDPEQKRKKPTKAEEEIAQVQGVGAISDALGISLDDRKYDRTWGRTDVFVPGYALIKDVALDAKKIERKEGEPSDELARYNELVDLKDAWLATGRWVAEREDSPRLLATAAAQHKIPAEALERIIQNKGLRGELVSVLKHIAILSDFANIPLNDRAYDKARVKKLLQDTWPSLEALAAPKPELTHEQKKTMSAIQQYDYEQERKKGIDPRVFSWNELAHWATNSPKEIETLKKK